MQCEFRDAHNKRKGFLVIMRNLNKFSLATLYCFNIQLFQLRLSLQQREL